MDPATGAGETTIARSPLDKPLGELTEEDIAQLTREDCRRFLKDRGMRRPSWNKFQAIQQVISLKALLEPPSAAEIRHKPPPPPPLPQAAVPSTRAEAISGDLVSATKERPPSPYRRRDRQLPATAAASGEPIPPESIVPSPSCRPEPSPAAGQLTIFYGGRVNVYDGVAAEKARAILQLAASPGFDDCPAPPEPLQRPCRFVPGPYIGTAGRVGSSFRESKQEWRASRETEPDVPSSREVSLQRYLVKRKDRFKGKRALEASFPSNPEMMYFTQKGSTQTTNEQSNRSNMISPTQPKPPGTPTRCSSMENKASKLHISVDLNKDGGDD